MVRSRDKRAGGGGFNSNKQCKYRAVTVSNSFARVVWFESQKLNTKKWVTC